MQICCAEEDLPAMLCQNAGKFGVAGGIDRVSKSLVVIDAPRTASEQGFDQLGVVGTGIIYRAQFPNRSVVDRHNHH